MPQNKKSGETPLDLMIGSVINFIFYIYHKYYVRDHCTQIPK
jgi:hypothetical protein